jgi:hypothetical protein
MPPPPEFRTGVPAGAGGYGAYPQGPAGPPPAVPPTLDYTLWLVIASAVLGVIGLVYSLGQKDQIVDRLVRDRGISLEDAQNAANLGIAVAVVVGLGFAVFFVFLAMKIRAGRNWARITLTVLLGLGVLSGLNNLAGDGPAPLRTLGVIGLLLDIAILVLVWLPASNAYIAARNRPSW